MSFFKDLLGGVAQGALGYATGGYGGAIKGFAEGYGGSGGAAQPQQQPQQQQQQQGVGASTAPQGSIMPTYDEWMLQKRYKKLISELGMDWSAQRATPGRNPYEQFYRDGG